jgi:hypothetical protein
MKMVVQTQDAVSVITDALTYTDTYENFALDYGEPLSRTVYNSTRQYEQGVRHCFTDGKNIIGGGDLPWEEGDAIIADVERIVQAQRTRLEAVQAEQQRLYDEYIAEQRAKNGN